MGFVKNILNHCSLYLIVKYLRTKELTQWTTHDQKALDFYSQFISSGELIFDVGANIGNRTKIFLKAGAKVMAIEPQDECIIKLESLFGKNKNFTVIKKALGASEGEAELMISNANTISSLSQEWIRSVKLSGRFADYSWENKQVVPTTTLDRLIDEYGIPSFIKIDVEGFEYEVLKGLSHPVNLISLEFVPEILEPTFKCIEHLGTLGDIRLNFSIGESMELVLGKFVTAKEIIRILTGYRNNIRLFGDVYCQFIGERTRH